MGFTLAISSGSETVCGLEDYLDLLAEDPETAVVCLVVEKIRRPGDFITAVEKARNGGKAVLATKLSRTPVGRDIMRSHTGAIADESWVYELAFQECGVLTAGTIDDMMDMAQLLSQIPASHWRRIGGIGVVTSSGGVAAIAADAAADHGIDLPAPRNFGSNPCQRGGVGRAQRGGRLGRRTIGHSGALSGENMGVRIRVDIFSGHQPAGCHSGRDDRSGCADLGL